MESVGPGDYVRPMNHTTFSMTGYDWFRAYTALSRSGSVSEEIRACERAWGAPFQRDEAAVRAIRTLPGYPSYARALRGILPFPLTLYRVADRGAVRSLESGAAPSALHRRFVQPGNSPPSSEKSIPNPSRGLLLVKGLLRDPEAIVMRGNLEGYELVVDGNRVGPVEVSVIDR